MKQFACTRECQVEYEGQIHHVLPGTVLTSDKNPKETCFVATESEEYKLNWETATLEELVNAKWTPKDAKEAMKELYGATLLVSKDDKKKDVAEKIIDIRYRAADL
jgi:hypothetical protein